MLIEFKVSNFRSFSNEQTLSMETGRDKAHANTLISCDGYTLSKTAAIYGANASGKSNLIKALRAMKNFVLSSATEMTLGDPIQGISPFRLDTHSSTLPSRFEATILIEGTVYVYGFSATSERIHEEWLAVRRPKGRMSQWISRQFDPETQSEVWQIRGPLRKDAALLQSKTRTNCLLLSRGAELNIEALGPLFLWFRESVYVFDLSYPPMGISMTTAKMLAHDADFGSQVLAFMRDADFGIRKLQVSEEPVFPDTPSNTPPELRKFITRIRELASEIGSEVTRHQVTTEHMTSDSGEPIEFDLDRDESQGTQRFFALAGPILTAIADCDLLVIDELDCSMHPLLTRKIVRLLQSAPVDRSCAQLIFATHDSTLMDPDLFRRDQIWLTEKKNDGSTDLYSLYDFDSESRPRSAEALERNYLAGRYGGIPLFGPTLEDLDAR